MLRRINGVIHVPKVYIRPIGEMGLGVFAGKRFREGELIERCPVLPLTKKEEGLVQSMVLRDYTFAWGTRPSLSCVVLGWGSLYNHSDQPNARYRQLKNRKQMEFIALRDIKKHEQIFIDYEWDEEEYVVCGVRRLPNVPDRRKRSRRS